MEVSWSEEVWQTAISTEEAGIVSEVSTTTSEAFRNGWGDGIVQ
jgi:hypothetical protein